MKIFFYITLAILASLYLIACTALGSNPDEVHVDKIKNSPQYNTSEEVFQNPKETPVYSGKSSTFFTTLIDVLFNGDERSPKQELPEVTSGIEKLLLTSHAARFIWFGHSSILLEIDGKRILVDPVFSKYASPIPGFVKRFQPPVYDIEDIENIDIVLISHDHYDHLDHKTIERLKARDIQYIVPLGVGTHLKYWGIKEKNIVELDWWEETQFMGLTITAAPAQHFSGRGLFNENSTLWASWAVRGVKQNIYFSGDSGYSEHYKEIGDRLGPFDLTFLENGAYNLDWRFVHQLPEEGVQANIDLRGKAMVPIHWGMFDLALHSWYEPIRRVTKEASNKGVRIIAPKIGQLVSTDEEFKYEEWWEPEIKNVK